LNFIIEFLERWNELILGDWMGDWWPLRSWPESPGFVLTAFAMMVITGLFPLDIPPKRYVHFGTGVVAIACYFIMGPKVIWIVIASTTVRGLIFYTVWPRRWREWKIHRISNHPASIAWAVAGFIAAIFVAHSYYLAVGAGTYPVPTGGPGLDFKYALMLGFIDMTYLAVSELGIWLRNRGRPPEPEALRSGSIWNHDFVIYFLIAILAAPVNFAALESYRDRYPLTTIGWFLWGFYVSLALQMLIQRREKIVRLLGELELKSKLAAVGEVSARIAHQTRHELGLIGMGLHQIERQLGPLPPENREAVLAELAKLEKARDGLSHMLTDVLKERMDGPESGKAEPAAPALSYAEIAEAEAEHLMPRAASAGVQLDVRVLAPSARELKPKDPDRFSQGLFNLIHNAIDAAQNRVSVVVDRNGGALLVTVADDGPGIPENLLGQVLKPFYSTKPAGTGMGLSVARAVAETEGGELRLRNAPGGGLEAEFRLPG